jgi:hypothetical protein
MSQHIKAAAAAAPTRYMLPNRLAPLPAKETVVFNRSYCYDSQLPAERFIIESRMIL